MAPHIQDKIYDILHQFLSQSPSSPPHIGCEVGVGSGSENPGQGRIKINPCLLCNVLLTAVLRLYLDSAESRCIAL